MLRNCCFFICVCLFIHMGYSFSPGKPVEGLCSKKESDSESQSKCLIQCAKLSRKNAKCKNGLCYCENNDGTEFVLSYVNKTKEQIEREIELEDRATWTSEERMQGCKIRFNGVIEIMCRSYGSPSTLDMYCNKDCKKIGLPYGKCVTGNQCECYVK